ncbi:MAG: DRTGG domain-containing protein [Dehalococcoidia bacterium]
MSTIIIASLAPGEGRSAVAVGLGALLAEEGRSVRLLRVRSGEGADANAEDDARTLASVPGCKGQRSAVTEQDAQAQAGDEDILIVEAPPGEPSGLAAKLAGRVVLVSSSLDDMRLGDLATASATLGKASAGVIVTRQAERGLSKVEAKLGERGLKLLVALPEDRLLAGPSTTELAGALHASHLLEGDEEDEAVENVMIGPVSADPGQPYFLQHGSKAVVNRFDKMDLHLAALATEPDCLILTGGRPPTPYLIDRASANDWGLSVLLSPESTVRTMELVDELYGRTRFAGERKLQRAVELFRDHADAASLKKALG